MKRLIILSVTMATFLPGIEAGTGRPPVAIRICFAAIFSPFTCTQPSSVNVACPIIFSTLD